MIRIAAFDPGLASFGAVVVETDGTSHRCVAADVFASEPLAKKLNHEMADDRVRRCRELQRWLSCFLDDARVVAAEAMGFPRGIYAVVSLSLGWGVLAGELERRGLPLATAHARLWRKHLVSGGKEHDAHVEAIRRFPSFVKCSGHIPNRLQLHALDALGIAAWSVTTNLVRSMVLAR